MTDLTDFQRIVHNPLVVELRRVRAERDQWKSLALDMGDWLRSHGHASIYEDEAEALLARLDQIGTQ